MLSLSPALSLSLEFVFLSLKNFREVSQRSERGQWNVVLFS